MRIKNKKNSTGSSTKWMFWFQAARCLYDLIQALRDLM